MLYYYQRGDIMDLIARKEYVEWLKSYKDKKIIKVVTGLRRVGKSTIFELYIANLLKSGVQEAQVVKINFEELENAHLREQLALYKYITNKMVYGKKLYVFLDEVQRVEGFEEVVDSLFVKDSFTILSIGRISYIKNFVAIPPIVKKLKERTGKSFRWFIIGNGSALETGHLVSQIKKYGVENEVVLLGEQANPYMFLKHADLFVCTSICESYGIVIDEAKVLGIPCLCTDYPAAYEVLSEEYGRIASIEQFDEIILAMIESPEVLKKYRDNLERYRPDNSEIIKKFITAIYEN